MFALFAVMSLFGFMTSALVATEALERRMDR